MSGKLLLAFQGLALATSIILLAAPARIKPANLPGSGCSVCCYDSNDCSAGTGCNLGYKCNGTGCPGALVCTER